MRHSQLRKLINCCCMRVSRRPTLQTTQSRRSCWQSASCPSPPSKDSPAHLPPRGGGRAGRRASGITRIASSIVPSGIELASFIDAYIHTYIRTYVRTYVRTYIHGRDVGPTTGAFRLLVRNTTRVCLEEVGFKALHKGKKWMDVVCVCLCAGTGVSQLFQYALDQKQQNLQKNSQKTRARTTTITPQRQQCAGQQ